MTFLRNIIFWKYPENGGRKFSFEIFQIIEIHSRSHRKHRYYVWRNRARARGGYRRGEGAGGLRRCIAAARPADPSGALLPAAVTARSPRLR